jgi:hypothetical protein
MKVKLLGITNVDFDIIGQQLIISSVSIRYWRKSGGIMNGTVYHLFKLVGLIKVCLNEIYNTVLIDKKKLCDKFPIQNGLKQGDVSSPYLFKFALEHAIRRVQEPIRIKIKWDTSAFGLY